LPCRCPAAGEHRDARDGVVVALTQQFVR